MKTIVLAIVVAAGLFLAGQEADAQSRATASRSDLEAVQAQMQALTERLDRLEAANTELKAENTELKSLVDRRDAETDYLRAQTKELREEAAVASNEIAKVKGSDWATRIKARGDLRYRHEEIHRERTVSSDGITTVEDAEDRYRHRIRARLGFDAQVSDNLKTTLLFATGADDPRSSNQSLGSSSTRKSIGVDMAYADWTFTQGGNIILGKQPYPFVRPGQSLFFDGDFNPEGGAIRYERGILFGSGYAWWLEERHNDNPSVEDTDTYVFGAQLGLRTPMFDASNLVAYTHYYNCSGCEGHSPLFANNSNGNTTYPVVPPNVTNILAFDYEIGELGAEFNTQIGNLPLQLWVNYAQNMASGVEEDTAYGAGFRLGRASNPRTWEAGAMYQSIDKDALFGQFIDSDFGNGNTDSEGWVLRGAYAPVRNIAFNLQYFINTLNKDVGTELDYDRLQVDLNWKF